MRKFFSSVFSIIWKIITAPFRFVGWVFKSIFIFFKKLFRPVIEFFSEEEDEDRPIGEVLQDGFSNPGSILPHLIALRKHIFRAVIGFVIMTAIAFVFVQDIMDWVAAPIGGIQELQAIEVTEPIGVVMRVALLSGFTGSLPYIALELVLFAAPGLSRRARIIGVFSIPLIVAFFVGGMLFAYYIMLDPALDVLLNFMGIATLPRPSSYIKFVTNLMFWIGVSFEFPLVAYVLAAMRILKPEALRDNWRIAIIAISILAAMVTPTVDPINMSIVMVPLIVLYGLGIIMAFLAVGGKRRRAKADAAKS